MFLFGKIYVFIEKGCECNKPGACQQCFIFFYLEQGPFPATMSIIRIRWWICTLSVLTLIHKQSIKVCEGKLAVNICAPTCGIFSSHFNIPVVN